MQSHRPPKLAGKETLLPMLHLVNNFWGNDSQCLGCLVSFSARVAVDMPMQPTDNIYTLFVLK